MVQELRYMTVDSQVTLPLDDIITLVLTDEVLEEATSALFEIIRNRRDLQFDFWVSCQKI